MKELNITEKEVILNQNYPNPFNPETQIKFYVKKRQHITLKIFDVAGREIYTLIDKIVPAGEHTALWEVHDMAGGMYIYQLSSESFSITRKLLLIK